MRNGRRATLCPTAFAQASPEDKDVWRRKGTPISFGSDVSVSLPKALWERVPSTYVVCADDRSILPDAQRRWATERATEVIEWPSDHCPQLSHPDLVAELLEKLARAI